MRTYRGRRRKIISEINVVPYIDVMLVLLIIFMITAPLITQGVKISLPPAPSEIISPGQYEPIVVSVDSEGNIFIDIGEDPEQPITDQVLINRIAAVMKYRPDTDILVAGDSRSDYGQVVRVMTLIQRAGVKDVGLITEPYSVPK
jgi:biopolymer transport protein TolR